MRSQVLWGVVLGIGLVAWPWSARSDDAVSVATTQQVYAAGDTVTVVVQNDSGRTIFVPGCHPFEVETFQEEDYVRVSREPCPWEGEAKPLPEGKHPFTFVSGETEGSGIFRISLVYGWGCDENAPLGRARCEEFTTVVSGSFRVGG